LRHCHESAGVLGSGGSGRTAGRRHSPNGHPSQSRKRSQASGDRINVAGGGSIIIMHADDATVAARLVLRVKKLFTEKNASLSSSASQSSPSSAASSSSSFSSAAAPSTPTHVLGLDTVSRTVLGSSEVYDQAKAELDDRGSIGESTLHLDRFFICRFLISLRITCTRA
jgi:hypothetical protein